MPPKKRASDANGEAGNGDGQPPAKMNRTSSDFESQDFTCDKTNKEGNKFDLKISTWNVDGLRAWIKKNGLDFLKYEQPDILCLQEIKCSEDKLPNEMKVVRFQIMLDLNNLICFQDLKDYKHQYYMPAKKEGYSGVALLSKIKPLDVTLGFKDAEDSDKAKEHDDEGRLITAEFDKFFLVTTYVPNAGRGLVTLPKRMEWDPILRAHLKKLDKDKPVILCGDLNVAHKEIDLKNPKTNKKSAGFTKEERDSKFS